MHQLTTASFFPQYKAIAEKEGLQNALMAAIL